MDMQIDFIWWVSDPINTTSVVLRIQRITSSLSPFQAYNHKLVARNLFDVICKIPINEFRLELRPGYVSSIRQRE